MIGSDSAVIAGRAETHRLCGFGFDFPVDVQVPKTIVGNRASEPPWQPLERRVPNLDDAYPSPTSDLVLATTKRSLSLLSANSTEPAALLQVLKLGESVVVVEWATGRSVARWTRELTAIRNTRFSPPSLVSPSR